MRSTYISHSGIRAKKLDPMIAWYGKVFGAVIHHESDALAFLSFDEEHHRLVICEDMGTVDRPPTATGVDHVGCGVATFTEFVATYERLKDAGILPFLPLDHVFTMSLHCHDPDGNEVELSVDCFPTKQECEAFARSDRMAEVAKPPFGYPFEPNALVALPTRSSGAPTADHHLETTMPSLSPHVREAGCGPGVVCIHSNASSSAQWRGLMDLLSQNHLVLAPDSYGSGKSPDWHSDHEITLRDEVDFIEPVLAKAGTPFVLVGHSYGAAVALMAALLNPGRVRALAVYEPTLFAVVDAKRPPPNGADGIRNVGLAAAKALDAGDKAAAAGHFIDYWMGSGSWNATPPQRKPAIADSVANVRRWSHALFSEPTPVQAFAALDMPILYMLGKSSPESAHAVAQVLLAVLPRVQVVEFPGLGHMAPVTHPEAINAAVAKFLSEV